MFVKGVFIVIYHLIFGFDIALSHNGEHDEGDWPTHGHTQVCDDGKTGIEIDIASEDWKCHETSFWSTDQWYMENRRCYNPEPAYHVCIDKDINTLYKASIPHSGPHRQVWAQYGEYNYLPPGRYVHNLEHDGVVFMYHPCAAPAMVDELRQTATSCLARHIITAFANLTQQFPFAVVTYGCVFQMSTVNSSAIKSWIRGRFGKSPEPDVYGNGKYNYGLIIPAPERTSYDYGDQSSPFCPDEATILSSTAKASPSPTSVSYSDEGYMDSSFVPYNDANSEKETAGDNVDMWLTEPSEISKPVIAPMTDKSLPFKFLPTIASITSRPTPAVSSQMSLSQKTVNVSKYDTLAKNAVFEHDIIQSKPFNEDNVDDDVTTKMGSEVADNSQPFVHRIFSELVTTTSHKKSVSPSSSSPAKTEADEDRANRTSFFFIIALAALLYSSGVVLGCLLHWCYRSRARNFHDSKVWRDDDGLGSFNIAAVVRKRPQLPSRGMSGERYQMLRDDFSDEDSFA